jgi:hypothetical protein
MTMISDIRAMEKFSPRQMEKEVKARAFIESRLESTGQEYELQWFRNQLPTYQGVSLKADGERIECMPTAFRSGIIDEKNLISSTAVSGRYYEEPNINFNPYTDKFSLATFYRAPSLAIRRFDVKKIMDAEEIEGRVTVGKKPHRCANIIVGNTRAPKNVVIAHYDSVLNGALDNASGTAVLLELARMGKSKENMFVFSGCEELSFDEPVYWGRGYRALEEKFGKTIERAKRVVVVDMIGSSSPTTIKDKRTRIAAFPIKSKKLFDRATIVSVEGKEWYPIYHSYEDGIGLIKESFLREGLQMVAKML